MPEGGPLYWVQQNRARRERATAIGKLTSAWVARVCNDWAALRRPAEVIATIVDDEFRSLCRLARDSERGGIVILVRDAHRVYGTKQRWNAAIQAVLSRSRCAGADRLEFRFGEDGIELPAGSH